ncbi:MAG: hypothetical protein SNH63_05080 [Rikenellaceae bacterium]
MRRILWILTLLVLCPSLSRAAAIEVESVDRVSSQMPMHKGEYMVSLTASFESFSSSNSSMLLLLENLDARGNVTSLRPSFGYFYNEHSMVGFRFKYTDIKGELSSADLDLGSVNDLSFSIPYFGINSRSYAYGVFHRSYTKLDRKGQFELFSEIEALYTHGRYDIEQDFTGTNFFLRSKTSSVSIDFNPGLSVNILPNVASFVSFGLGGLYYSNVNQYDEAGEYIGGRHASKFSLKVDVLAINFGVAIYLWSDKWYN